MSNIKDLIAELCPNGVEFKNLGEVGNFLGGLNGKTKKDFTPDANAFFVPYINIYKNLAVDFNQLQKVQIEKNEQQNILQLGDVLFTGSSETREECGISSVVTIQPEQNLYLNSFCFCFRFNDKNLLLPGFSKYIFSSTFLREQIIKTASGVTRFNVSKKKMEQVKIPIPPLPVQAEIVRILDTFTELISELTKELQLRKKQYEYYRDKLLTFEDVEYKKLGEIVILKAGSAISSKEISPIADENKKFLCYGGNGIRGYVSSFNRSGKYPIIGRQGALCGNVNFASGEFYATEHAVTVSCDEKFNARFLYHLLTAMNLNKYKTEGAQPGLSVTKLNEIEIPIPPLAEQERIANILDKFDKLCNDLCEGIPAEIAARKKQYEYYRDKLLIFEDINRT